MKMDALERAPLAARVAKRLLQLILSGSVKPKERLPPERELAQLLKVTRTTVREAVKILETLKLVVVRQGDGVRVLDFTKVPNLEILADLLFSSGSLDARLLSNILEARRIFGVVMAELAARRRTEAQLEAYRREVEALASLVQTDRLWEADLACFDALAEASGNLVFVFVLNSIRSIYTRHREVFAPLYRDPARVVRGHQDLLRAIEARDPTAAGQIAGRLLEFEDPERSQ